LLSSLADELQVCDGAFVATETTNAGLVQNVPEHNDRVLNRIHQLFFIENIFPLFRPWPV
jgi:hypothetical protein